MITTWLLIFTSFPIAYTITPNFFVEMRLSSSHESLVLNYPRHTVQKVGNSTFVIGPFKENEKISISLSLPEVPFRYISRTLDTERTWNSEYFELFQTHVHYRSICAPGLYGPRCLKFCRSRDDHIGHYQCSDMGMKICSSGWTGSNCDMMFVSAKVATSSSETSSTSTRTPPTTSVPSEVVTRVNELKGPIKPTASPYEVLSDYYIVEHRFPGLLLLICFGVLLGVLLFLIFLILCVHRDAFHPIMRLENWLQCRRQTDQTRYHQNERSHSNQYVHKVYSLPVDLHPQGILGGKVNHHNQHVHPPAKETMMSMRGEDTFERYTTHRLSTTSCPAVGPSAIIPTSTSTPSRSNHNNSSNCYFAYEAIDLLPLPPTRAPKPYLYVSNEHLNV